MTGPVLGAAIVDPGEMAERTIASVLKTVEPARVPGVRIPLSPPKIPGLVGISLHPGRVRR